LEVSGVAHIVQKPIPKPIAKALRGMVAVSKKPNPWVQSRDGVILDLLEPNLRKYTIEEAAHSLARINRFSGHTRSLIPYSVAQHSVLVSRHLPERFAYAGLAHDLHESIIGDVTSPVKWALEALGGGSAFNELDGIVMRAVQKRFGVKVGEECKFAVREQDLRALVTERRDLLGDIEAKSWGIKFGGMPVLPWEDIITPWDVQKAERIFLAEFERLKKRPV
jgi:uncharacterized protein